MVADQLIGEVEPEWKVDGFGLRGEQVEPSDDDDLVWDTDVWTRLNPEQDAIAGTPVATGACCQCLMCSIQSASDCASLGGTYLGDDTPCDSPNPCCALVTLFAPFFADPIHGGDGQYYLTQIQRGLCDAGCPGIATICWSDGPVDPANRYLTITDTYTGCNNSGGCITSGTLVRSDTRNPATCGIDETCSGEITYSGTCSAFPPFHCADGDPGFTLLTSTLSDLCS